MMHVRAWVINGVIDSLQTSDEPIDFMAVEPDVDAMIVDAVVDADYIDAAVAREALTFNGELRGMEFVSQHKTSWTAAPLPPCEERLAAARASATLTRREFFLGLDALGIYDTVMSAELPRAARIELDTATSFERTCPTLVEMAHSLSFTDEQLDALFGIEVTP